MKWSPEDDWPSTTTMCIGGKTIGISSDINVITTSHGSSAHNVHFLRTLRLSSIVSCVRMRVRMMA